MVWLGVVWYSWVWYSCTYVSESVCLSLLCVKTFCLLQLCMKCINVCYCYLWMAICWSVLIYYYYMWDHGGTDNFTTTMQSRLTSTNHTEQYSLMQTWTFCYPSIRGYLFLCVILLNRLVKVIVSPPFSWQQYDTHLHCTDFKRKGNGTKPKEHRPTSKQCNNVRD